MRKTKFEEVYEVFFAYETSSASLKEYLVNCQSFAAAVFLYRVIQKYTFECGKVPYASGIVLTRTNLSTKEVKSEQVFGELLSDKLMFMEHCSAGYLDEEVVERSIEQGRLGNMLKRGFETSNKVSEKLQNLILDLSPKSSKEKYFDPERVKQFLSKHIPGYGSGNNIDELLQAINDTFHNQDMLDYVITCSPRKYELTPDRV